MEEHRNVRAGFVMGLGAIALWSTAAATTFWGGSTLGVWQFLALACGIGGVAQTASYLLLKKDIRSILVPPPRLWVVMLVGFVLYMLVYSQALVNSANKTQTVCVGLINHLWPTLTVVFAALLVPGTTMTFRLAIAILLSLAGLVLANWDEAMSLFGSADPTGGAPRAPVGPYLLAGLAAVLWAGYSAFLARWRSWANRYATAPAGFLIVSAIAAAVCCWTGQWSPMGGGMWAVVCFGGLGPYGAGYMLWELALHRAPASVLGLLAGAIPVLSTLCLFLLFSFSGMTVPGQTRYVTLLIAAGMVGSAVVVAVLPKRNAARREAGSSPPTR
jgi:drug/metabolite transporter (DMT)-like permease